MSNSNKTDHVSVKPADPPSPQKKIPASRKEEDEEILKELCSVNGLSPGQLQSADGHPVETLEIFFSGFPRIVGMSNFPHVTSVTIMGQLVDRIEGISCLTKLKELWISECQVKRIENLDSNKMLKRLYLYTNKISKIENLDHLSELEVLWLNNNSIRMIENLSCLVKLRQLNLAENNIDKIGYSLDPVTRLEDLSLSGNKISSFRDLTNLSRLPNLKSVSLKDPNFSPCPVSLLCNYSTHCLYHFPNLKRLDSYDISSRSMTDVAETTVSKKKMYYNMRIKILKRNMSDLMTKLTTYYDNQLYFPHQKIRVFVNVLKQIEREMSESGLVTAGDGDKNDRDSKLPEEKMKKISHYKTKISAVGERVKKLEKKCSEIENYYSDIKEKIENTQALEINRLMVELESGGNVRLEEGTASDVWFTSCHDLVLSRFCSADYKEMGIVGIKIHRIIRVHNRILRVQFDDKLNSITEDKETEYYPGVRNVNYKKNLEYLFWMWDPDLPGGIRETDKVLEEGFMDADTYLKIGKDGAVPLSNSLSLADRHRIKHHLKQRNMSSDAVDDSCPFRYGQIVVCKTYLGKTVQALDDRPISKSSYQKIDALFKPRKKALKNETCLSQDSYCECATRQCEWYVFDHELVLPEYIIDCEYITKVKNRSPFSFFYEWLNESKERKLPPVPHPEEADNYDDEVINMEPEIKPLPKLIALTEDLILKMSKADSLESITVLNLHNNSLTKLKNLHSLVNLKKLIISFNDLSRLEDISHMGLEYVDASFNKISSLDGVKSVSKLKYLDLSWNRLHSTRDDISILRKHAPALETLDIQHNRWQKPSGLRLRVIGRLKSLTLLDGQPVTEAQATAALRMVAGSRISQVSLLNHGRTDTRKPRSLSLLSTAQVLGQLSRNKPEKLGENDTQWYYKITSLNLNGQHLSKLSNLEKLENLRFASFNDNDLTRIEGLDSCIHLEELSLENNSISKVEGISKLTMLRRLSLGHNYISSLDNAGFYSLNHLHYLSLENNRLASLHGLQRMLSLIELYLGNNSISNIREIYLLKTLPNLVILDLCGNPVAGDVDNYRLFVIYHLKTLKALDGQAIENNEGNLAKDTFGGRLTSDFVAEKMNHSNFPEVRELDLPNCAIRTVDLGTGENFINLRSINLEHNNLTSLSGLVHLVNLRVLCLNHNHIECIVARPKASKQKVQPSGLSKMNGIELFAPESYSPVLESVEVLHLGYNGIKDIAALQISRMSSLKALFLQGNEITKIDGLEGLHDLRELVLDRNKIKNVSDMSFMNQWNLQELHLEENRIRELTSLNCLENLHRLYLGSNRIQDLSELEKLDGLNSLVEISLVNNAITRRLMHRPMLMFRLPQILVIDGIPVSEEERTKAELYFMDQQMIFQPQTVGQTSTAEGTLPGIGQYKAQIPVKVTNMQLSSPPLWNGTILYEDISQDPLQRGGGRKRTQQKTTENNNSNRAGNNSNYQQGYGFSYTSTTNAGSRPFSYLNHNSFVSQQTAEYIDSLARMNMKNQQKKH